jgi:hypothetical protein
MVADTMRLAADELRRFELETDRAFDLPVAKIMCRKLSVTRMLV